MVATSPRWWEGNGLYCTMYSWKWGDVQGWMDALMEWSGCNWRARAALVVSEIGISEKTNKGVLVRRTGVHGIQSMILVPQNLVIRNGEHRSRLLILRFGNIVLVRILLDNWVWTGWLWWDCGVTVSSGCIPLSRRNRNVVQYVMKN